MSRRSQTIAPAAQRRTVHWVEIFDALDRARIPEDFLFDRDDALPQTRPDDTDLQPVAPNP